MLRTITSKSIAEHDADAILVGNLEDFSKEELDALEKRYPTLFSAVKRTQGAPPEKWFMGKMAFFNPGKPDAFIVACLKDKDTADAPSYRAIRDTIRKLAGEAKDRKIKRVAIGRLGCGKLGDQEPHVKADAVEVVIPAALRDLDSKLEVDFYR